MSSDDVDSIVIENCNSIVEARVSLRKSSLNIKYGPNGIGKSTIARALVLRPEGDDALDELLPFKYRLGGDHPRPSVSGADDIRRVLVFDESYVSQFVFQADEVVKNSFEIFINTAEYRRGLSAIEAIFEELKGLFLENEVLDRVIAALTELRDAFTVTRTGAIAKTSRGFRALAVGGKLTTIPKPLPDTNASCKAMIRPAGSLGRQGGGLSWSSLTTVRSVPLPASTSKPLRRSPRSTTRPP